MEGDTKIFLFSGVLNLKQRSARVLLAVPQTGMTEVGLAMVMLGN